MPRLTPMAQAGQRAFDATCAKCPGAYGLGTDKGPPFLNPIYNPGHHPDDAFLRAVRNSAFARITGASVTRRLSPLFPKKM